MRIDSDLRAADLATALQRLWQLSAAKIGAIESTWRAADGAPVFTVDGRYTSRGWTEWTQGFQFGAALQQFDATGEAAFLELGRARTLASMGPHLTHFGVHDHGFNNVSTYGHLLRLIDEGRIEAGAWEREHHALALRCSGAVQARRWTRIAGGGGFVHSFNGPHSLFADTIRSLRSLALAHRLGHRLLDEHDEEVSLLGRLVEHLRATERYTVYHGDGRDAYDVRGRVAHESLFNVVDGRYRCPGTQQGFSPFTTWTRGLAWVMLGAAEQLEFVASLGDAELEPCGGRDEVEALLLRMGRATCDFYLDWTPTDGVPFWDTGAPGLARIGNWRARASDPFNDEEPVDSSAAAIAAQAFLRLGRQLATRDPATAGRYRQAGLGLLRTLLDDPYLSGDDGHQGLLLHAVYHVPNGWDHVPAGCRIPCGEACIWGDYHLREAALLIQRELDGGPYPSFFASIRAGAAGSGS
jgi:hypothetical protein